METAVFEARAQMLKARFTLASSYRGDESRQSEFISIMSDSLALKHDIQSWCSESKAVVKKGDAIIDTIPLKDCAETLGESEYHTDNGGLKQRFAKEYDINAIWDDAPAEFIRNRKRMFKGSKFDPSIILADPEETFLAGIIRAHTRLVPAGWVESK